jgi:hypothetical protein
VAGIRMKVLTAVLRVSSLIVTEIPSPSYATMKITEWFSQLIFRMIRLIYAQNSNLWVAQVALRVQLAEV